VQAQVRPSGRQPPRQEPRHRPRGGDLAEPRVLGGSRALRAAGVRAHPRQPQRRDGGGLPAPGPPGHLRAVPPGGQPRAPRQPLPLRRLHPAHGGAPPAVMPKDPSLKSVLVIGSGPIVIGQACEFDYSGTQAIKALQREGVRVSLVNSNPATIMTDPEYADRTYVEPLTAEVLEAILERERPNAVLPTVGGQTALNLAVEISRRGVLDRLGIRLIGASRQAVEIGEDRRLFKE